MAYVSFIKFVLSAGCCLLGLMSAQRADFENGTAGEPPSGWTVNAGKPAKPAVVVQTAGGKALLINPLNTALRHGTSAALPVQAGGGVYRLDLRFAFGGAGRTLRLWSRQNDDPDPAALNLAIEGNTLMQFHAGPHEWSKVAHGLLSSAARTEPRWQRLQVEGNTQALRIWVWPDGSDRPANPAIVTTAHRAGLRFDSLHLGCDRLSPDAFFLIDDIQLETLASLDITPAPPEPLFPLWSGSPIPEFQDELPDLPGATHAVIHDPTDGQYTFLHGAAIIHHKGKFYANWASSPVDENSDGETLQGRSSPDGIHWTSRQVIGQGDGKSLNNSHGIYHEHNGVLWTYSARFGTINTGVKFPGLKVEGFTLNDRTGAWESQGIVGEGMWPYNQPVRLSGGNWITGGQGTDGDPGVLISEKENFRRWRTVQIPAAKMPRGFGETTLFADRPGQVTAVIRPGRTRRAWVSTSTDDGFTWTEAQPSNFPIGISKMYAGTLSTGQRYLVANFPSPGLPNDRYTMVIAVGKPKADTLSKIYRLRFGPPALDYPGFAKSPQWSYPYAHEYDGKLYVVYSIGKEKCGMSIIPLASLTAE